MMITLYRRNKDGSLRYFSISNRQGHLFSAFSFQTIEGSSVSAGREREYLFDSRREMDATIRELISRRLKRDYRVLYSYFRKHEYQRLRGFLSNTG